MSDWILMHSPEIATGIFIVVCAVAFVFVLDFFINRD